MSRPKNPDNKYQLVCPISGQIVHTNPKQFRETCDRYNVSPDVLEKSYVCRAGRNILKAEKLNAQEIVAKYGIDIRIASQLKACAKVVAPVVENAPIVLDVAEIPQENLENNVEPQLEVVYVAEPEEELVPANA